MLNTGELATRPWSTPSSRKQYWDYQIRLAQLLAFENTHFLDQETFCLLLHFSVA